MALPNINTYYVNNDEIALYWKASPKSSIKKWNVYGSPTAPINLNDPIKGVDISSFTLIREGLANRDVELTPGSVYTVFSRSDLGVSDSDTYYFLITSVDGSGNESSMETDKLHGVPLADDYFVDEAGQPVNVVYKNFEFTLDETAGWDSDRFLNMISLLGRPAKQLRIQANGTGTVQLRINSFNSDPITISSSDAIPFKLDRGELQFRKLWFNKTDSNSISLRIFVAA